MWRFRCGAGPRAAQADQPAEGTKRSAAPHTLTIFRVAKRLALVPAAAQSFLPCLARNAVARQRIVPGQPGANAPGEESVGVLPELRRRTGVR